VSPMMIRRNPDLGPAGDKTAPRSFGWQIGSEAWFEMRVTSR